MEREIAILIKLIHAINRIRKAIDELPLGRRQVFVLSRFEGLKNKEIAEKLGISVKTVENQIGSALKYMRKQLTDYLPLFIVLFLEKFLS